ncbi:uncharacterized protein LOC106660953 [Cimex lectularius]|uniref:Uncharacterized protein n=1 Tax=Cimex lectularius TaxID=79782 RepID=A0A8I6R903_CIMLE|nr:uncharacterized protein LOC106660953 [Cimex lectularius]
MKTWGGRNDFTAKEFLLDSDVELKSSEEDELLNLYDKKLRDSLYAKKSDDEEPEQMTSRIGEYLKKMRAEEKILIGNLKNGKANEEEIAQNRKNKEAILKRFDYKDQLRRMKSQNFFDRFDSSESESDAGSDLDMDALTKTMDKISTGKSHSEKIKTLKSARKSFMSRNTDVRKKIAEMKKILDNTELQQEEDQLFKTKQAVADWLDGEGAAAFKKRFNNKPPSKLCSDTTIKGFAGKKVSKTEVKKPDRSPLPPVRTNRALRQSVDNFKKEDVLKILRDIEPIPSKAKSFAAGQEKPSISKNAKKPVASKVNSGLPSRLLKSKSDFSKTISKTNLTKNPTSKTTAK